MSLPDASPGKQRRNCWLRVGMVTKYVTVRSRVGWFRGHWSRAQKRSVRCPGEGCPACSSGVEPRVFTYVFVEIESGEVLVWEIPERLFSLAQELEASTFEGPGCVLALVREGTASNSRISASIVHFEDVEELDIWPFVDTLGGTLESVSSPSSPQGGRMATARSVPCNT